MAGGAGLIRSPRGVVLVPGTLPGETVDWQPLPGRAKDVLRGNLLQVRQAHPERVEPACPLYGRCGGCDLMHAGPDLQARIRQDIFRDALSRQGGEEARNCRDAWENLPLVRGKEWEYRSRARVHPDAQGRPCFRERAGNALVPVPDCPVLHRALRGWLASAPVLPPAAEARASRGRTTPRGHWASREASGSANDPLGEDQALPGINLFAGDNGVSAGGGERRISIRGQEFRFGQEAFFQSNTEMLGRLLDWMIPRVDAFLEGREDPVMADLYGGMGTFSRFLPSRGTIWMVEENPESCRSARKAFGSRKEVRIHQGSVDTWPGRTGRLDLAVVDPPRGGLSRSLTEHLVRMRPGLLFYVSCDPVTLARDTRALLAGGMEIRDGALFDFYPQTWHLESLLVFGPAGAR